MSAGNIVIAVTGASGSAYAVRLMQVLARGHHHLHVVVSDAARQVAERELGCNYPSNGADVSEWMSFLSSVFQSGPTSAWGFDDEPLIEGGSFRSYSQKDYSSGIASCSFLTTGMVICPCSMGTLSSIACGASTNLIQRAADVHLKERRPLVVVPRETPLGLIGLENMTRLTQAGATIMPSMPGFYHRPACIADLVDFVVARICDHLKIDHSLMKRWGQDSQGRCP